MAAIPPKSLVTYQGEWPCCVKGTPPLDFAAIATRLVRAGLPIRNHSLDWSLFRANYDVSMQLQVENGLGYGDVNDIIAIVRHMVFAEENRFPLSDNIVLVQTPGGTPQPTGQPGTGAPPGAPREGCIAGTAQNLQGNFSLGCWFDSLTSKGLSIVGILALLIVAGLALIFFAPVPRLPRFARR